jgi:hypothetical protein
VSASSRTLPFLAASLSFLAAAAAGGCATGGNLGVGGAGGSGPVTTSSTATTSPFTSTSSGMGGAGGATTSTTDTTSTTTSTTSSTTTSTTSTTSSTTTSTTSTTSSTTSTTSSTTSTTSTTTGGGSCPIGHVVISEVRTRGAAGGSDEFVELYNPTGAPIVLDSMWVLEGLKAGASATTMYSARWTGKGTSIPAHGHFLIGGSSYTQSPAADDSLSTGISDATALRLMHANAMVDALCFYVPVRRRAS